MRAIIGLSPEDKEKAVGAAADAEQQYKQAGHAAADQAAKLHTETHCVHSVLDHCCMISVTAGSTVL